ncbi:MAG: extracellular solute-binding protein [Lachnospiraceae bacterium]|nr:extracellular solute-binding protein [Lachnospiraceae bacterium]MDE6186124.1 extracellular solute-binding protein [Lachnospiraceae bacterium]
MKKIIASFLSIAMLMGLLCGCGAGGQALTEEEKNTIVIWHDKEEAVAEALLAELKKSVPDVDVRLEHKSNLTEALKMVGNDPKAAPDLYFFAHDKIGVYAEMGILTPITELIAKEELENAYVGMTLDAATYKGEIYQLPVYFETLLFMYNRLYMAKERVPATTEELYTYMSEKTHGGHYGFVEQHSTAYYSAGWIHGFGGYIMDAEGDVGLNKPETIEALMYHKKFVELMPGESEYSTVNTLFQEGKAHATIGGPWLVSASRAAGMDLGIAPMPVIDETGLPISPYMGVQGVQVLKYAAENKREAVVKVLNGLMQPEVGVSLAKVSGCAPAVEACYEKEEVTSDDVVMAMRQTAENTIPMPNRPEMDIMWTVAADMLVNINMSGQDVEESCKAAQKSAEDLIRKMQ